MIGKSFKLDTSTERNGPRSVFNRPPLATYVPREAPVYVYIRTPHIIDIVVINNHSNFVSDVGLNRPIIILEYDEKVSSIYLGTMDYNISEVIIDGYLFKKITTRQADKELFVFVFDHQKYDTFNLVILDIPTNVIFQNISGEETPNR